MELVPKKRRPSAGPDTTASAVADAQPVAVPKLLTVEEVATILGVHAQTVRRSIPRDELPFVKIGRTHRYRPVDVNRYIDRHLVRA
jgi:excisionase family DNA binding protein